MAKGVIGNLRVNLGIDSAEFQAGLNKASSSLDKFAGAAKIAGAAIAAAFAAGVTKAVSRVEKMEASIRRIDQALHNSGNAAKTSGRELSEWASQLERRTGRAAQEVLDIGANLASFNFGEEVFHRAIELADDMAAAWGGDLRGNMEGLARALDDPANGFAMLRKRGIALTDAQEELVKKLMKSNDKLGAQKVVLEALEAQVKGVAASGFQGLTKSLSNLNAAIDGFFDTIVSNTGFGTMLAGAVDVVTRAIDLLTQNLGTVAEYAAVAGGSLAILAAPAILSSIGTLTVAIGTGLVGAVRMLTAAIMANPLGALAVAITVAVTAIYHFRDEIQKAIGVDVVEIVKTAGNAVINSFRAAYEDVKFVWSNFGNVMGAAVIGGVNIAIRAINSLANSAKVVMNDLIATMNLIPGVSIEGFKLDGAVNELDNPYATALSGALEQHNVKIKEIMASDPIGQLGSLFEGSTPAAVNFGNALGGINDQLDGMGGEGGKAGRASDMLAEAARIFEATRTPLERYQATIARLNELLAAGAINQDTYNRAVIQAQDAFKQAEKAGKATENVFVSIGETIAQSFGSAIQGLIDGSKKAIDVVKDLLSQLASMVMNRAFQALLGSIGGSLFGGGSDPWAGLRVPSFASGGTIMPGGYGGIDSQLVMFRKSPNERVDITKPGQTLDGGRGGAVSVAVEVFVNDDGTLGAIAKTAGRDAAVSVVQANNKARQNLYNNGGMPR